MRWEGSTVLVTGASRGIGRAIAIAASAKGARLGLVARSADSLAEVRDRLGGRVATATVDLAERQQLGQAFDSLCQEIGPVDILVNCAGVGCWGAFVDTSEGAVDEPIAVNLVAAIELTRLVLPSMIRRRSGHVVNIGSVAGRVGVPFESLYSASKFGLVGFSEALALEVRPFGVGVSVINPGPIATTFAANVAAPHYRRRRPRPLPPEHAAAAVITAVERGASERVLPRWLKVAQVVRTLAPALYEAGMRRAFAPEFNELATHVGELSARAEMEESAGEGGGR